MDNPSKSVIGLGTCYGNMISYKKTNTAMCTVGDSSQIIQVSLLTRQLIWNQHSPTETSTAQLRPAQPNWDQHSPTETILLPELGSMTADNGRGWLVCIRTVSCLHPRTMGDNQILYVCEPPSASSYPALVTALVVTVSRTLLGYECTPKVTVYPTSCQSRIAQERTTSIKIKE